MAWACVLRNSEKSTSSSEHERGSSAMTPPNADLRSGFSCFSTHPEQLMDPLKQCGGSHVLHSGQNAKSLHWLHTSCPCGTVDRQLLHSPLAHACSIKSSSKSKSVMKLSKTHSGSLELSTNSDALVEPTHISSNSHNTSSKQSLTPSSSLSLSFGARESIALYKLYVVTSVLDSNWLRIVI
jgi:hypothetical protein